MTPILENAALGSDLDLNSFSVLNLGGFVPVPSNLVDINDPRLSDQRAVLAGTVVDASVSETAAIQQSKLNLNGNIPTPWLGNSASQAAEGDLVQLASLKGANSGYVGLDSNGRIAVGHLPSTGPQLGTVTSVTLTLPPHFAVPSPVITTSGTFTVSWENQPNQSWFGSIGASVLPDFLTSQIPVGLIPNLDASIFTTGEFPPPFWPIAIGLGASHAIGLTPDPGDGSKGTAADYLGRDMQFHQFESSIAYQPNVPPVVISLGGYLTGGLASVIISEKLAGANLFYNTGGGMTLVSGTSITLKLAVGTVINAYSAKDGYNNSGMTTYVVPSPAITS